MRLNIPGRGETTIRHLVLDFNGTVAVDGKLIEGLAERIADLAKLYTVHIITADTFGSVRKELEGLQVKVAILQSDDHTAEKAAFVESLGATECVAVGNGNNDEQMLRRAAVGIAVLGEEGCAAAALQSADLLVRNIDDALRLLTSPQRLVATLRR